MASVGVGVEDGEGAPADELEVLNTAGLCCEPEVSYAGDVEDGEVFKEEVQEDADAVEVCGREGEIVARQPGVEFVCTQAEHLGHALV